MVGGLMLSLVLSKVLPAKTPEVKIKEGRQRMPAFVPFEFVVVYGGSLPQGLEVLEESSFE